MGLTGVLDIAKSGLLASQTAIQTTSHNISNVNTPGYTRQRVNIETGAPVVIGGHYMGTGVLVGNIERVYDSFLGLQIYDAAGDGGRYSNKNDVLSRLEGIFNDSQEIGIGDILNDFFRAVHDVANDPSSYSARTVLLGRAQTLTGRINNLDSRIKQEINNIELQMKGEVNSINSLSGRISNLNGKIQQAEAGGQQANDLRDERDSLIKELAGKIDVTVLDDGKGGITILAAGGSAIVSNNSASALSVFNDINNNSYYGVMFGNNNITNNISSGKLKGLLEARDMNYQDSINKIGTLAASLTKEFNILHRVGYGLDGSTGLDFFNALNPDIISGSANTGGAQVTSKSITNLSAATLSNYEIRFSSVSSFSIVDTTTNTVISSGNSYTSGADIDFQGIRVVIANSTGTPQSGDVFKVNITKNAAMNFGVLLTDANKFAAAKTQSALPGDNANALDMVNLEETKVLSNSGSTFSGFYSSLVSDIGLAVSEASVSNDAQASVIKELDAYRESVSGVSLDEEAANLIKYQHAYEAAAKVITVVDSMFETLMNLR